MKFHLKQVSETYGIRIIMPERKKAGSSYRLDNRIFARYKESGIDSPEASDESQLCSKRPWGPGFLIS